MTRHDYYGMGRIVLHVATPLFETQAKLYGLTPEARGWSCNTIDTIAAKLRRIRNS